MIDIPLNKALVAVEIIEDEICTKCALLQPVTDEWGNNTGGVRCNSNLSCEPHTRKDGKNVIFKLVDLPEVG